VRVRMHACVRDVCMAGCPCMHERQVRGVFAHPTQASVSLVLTPCPVVRVCLFGRKIHLNIWMYRRHETYVWEDQTEVSVRKLPNDVLFPLRSCSFEGFDVPCPRLAEGWWQA